MSNKTDKYLENLRRKYGSAGDAAIARDHPDQPSGTARSTLQSYLGPEEGTWGSEGGQGTPGEIYSGAGRYDFTPGDVYRGDNQATQGDTGGLQPGEDGQQEIAVRNVPVPPKKPPPRGKQKQAQEPPPQKKPPRVYVSDSLFSEAEASLHRDTLTKIYEAILDHADDTISATNKAHRKAEIWSTVDDTDIAYMVDLQLSAAKSSKQAARVTRGMLMAHKHIRIGAIVIPKSIETWRFYHEYGFYIPGMEHYMGRKQRGRPASNPENT